MLQLGSLAGGVQSNGDADEMGLESSGDQAGLLQKALGGHPGGAALTPSLYRPVIQVKVVPCTLMTHSGPCYQTDNPLDDYPLKLTAPGMVTGGGAPWQCVGGVTLQEGCCHLQCLSRLQRDCENEVCHLKVVHQ